MTAAVLTVAVLVPAAVVWTVRRRAAARRWAEGDAVLAEVEAQIQCLTEARDRIGWNRGEADEPEGKAKAAMFSKNVESRLKALGWDGQASSAVLASLVLRARRAGFGEPTEMHGGCVPERPTGSHAIRIQRLLDEAERRGSLRAMARGAIPVVVDDGLRELLNRR